MKVQKKKLTDREKEKTRKRFIKESKGMIKDVLFNLDDSMLFVITDIKYTEEVKKKFVFKTYP